MQNLGSLACSVWAVGGGGVRNCCCTSYIRRKLVQCTHDNRLISIVCTPVLFSAVSLAGGACPPSSMPGLSASGPPEPVDGRSAAEEFRSNWRSISEAIPCRASGQRREDSGEAEEE